MNRINNTYPSNTGYYGGENHNTTMSNVAFHVPSQEQLASFQNNLYVTNQNLAALSEHMQATGAAIYGSNESVVETVEKLRKDMKKDRRKKTVQKVAALVDGIYILQFFDDNSSQGMPLFMNVGAKYIISRWIFPSERKEKTVVKIWFPEQKMLILVPENGSPKILHDAFIEAGVVFNTQFSMSRSTQALAEFFIPQIRECENSILYSGLAGWDEKIFMTKENFRRLRCYRHFPDSLPVLEKSLTQVHFGYDRKRVTGYFRLINMVKGYRLRFWLFLYPYVGILKTILDRHGYVTDFILTLLTDDFGVKRYIVNYLQLFNRYQLCPTNIEGSEKRVMETVACTKDEILVVDHSTLVTETPYKRNTVENNLEKIMKISVGEKILPPPYNRDATFVLAVLSDVGINFKGYTLNFVVEPEDFKKVTISSGDNGSDYIGENFTEFVDWATENYDRMEARLGNCPKEFRDRKATIKAVSGIVEARFADIGINVWEVLKIDVNTLFEKGLFECDNIAENDLLLRKFRELVRENIQKTVVLPKKHGVMENGAVYFDEEWMWIPSFLCTTWLTTAGLRKQRKRLLFTLKSEGILYADEGYTHRTQIQFNTLETIMLKRDFFTKTGEVEVISLGREYHD